MKAKITSLITGLLLLPIFSVLGAAHTPPPGSDERKAICDVLRVYVQRAAFHPVPKAIVFKVDFLRVDGDFAFFEGIPVFKDGSDTTQYLPDMAYAIVLRNSGGGWRMLHDLSRSDVPSDAEVAQLRRQLAGVPTSILPDFWRQLLKR